MPYVGNKPEVGNFRKCDAITTSATATYNLLVGGVAVNPNQNQCIVSLNGVIQSSGNSYTIASSQITFASTLASSDVIDFILILGDTLDVGVPSDDSVGLAQLSATGSPSSSNFLRGDNSWTAVSSTTINNNADNRVITGSGTANTLEGETNFIYNGTIAGLGATGASADLGVGLHIRTSDSSGSVSADADELVLESSAGVGMTMLGGTGNDLAIDFGDSGGSQRGRLIYANNGDNMMFHTAGAERMRISSGGEVFINRTSQHASGYNGRVSVLDAGNDSVIFAENTKSSGLGASLLKVFSAQDTTNSSYNLMDGHAPSGRFLVRDSGNVQNTNNSYGSISDERVKQDITDANSQWEDIKALKVKNFKLKSDTSKTQLGVIAQELEASGMNGLVEDALPEKEDVALHSDFGTIDDDGNFTQGEKVKSVKYSVLYMKSIKALQEAMEKIETLETENTDIKARLTALENA